MKTPLNETQDTPSVRLQKFLLGLKPEKIQMKGVHPYLSIDFVKAQLNRILGPENWSTTLLKVSGLDPEGEGQTVCVHLRLTTKMANGTELVREDIGMCSNRQGSTSSAMDTAYKGAVSDALKRCASSLGPALGLGLKEDLGGDPLLHPQAGHKWLQKQAKTQLKAKSYRLLQNAFGENLEKASGATLLGMLSRAHKMSLSDDDFAILVGLPIQPKTSAPEEPPRELRRKSSTIELEKHAALRTNLHTTLSRTGSTVEMVELEKPPHEKAE